MTRKTTIYLPDNLKSAIEAEALHLGCSEAQVIRDAVEAALTRPRPNYGILDGEPMAERVDELLRGFAER